MLEVLSPAGSGDALIAAVQNGADAVYLGYGSFNARMNAKNFTREQLQESVSYCHVRGVKVYLTLNTLVLDRELKALSQVILDASRAGIDAVLVQDWGVCHLVRQLAPDLPIHGSTQLSVHNLAGAVRAAEMGMTRVVLARELSREQIAYICQNSPIEVEVFVHGALCMCYSGQCYMSAIIGRRSGNRGQCAQPCRMSYGFDRSEGRYPLSLKDNCLVSYLRDLEAIGVACVKIEGRMKRAEYVAIATKIYKDAVMGRPVTAQQLKELAQAFSRQGFTQGYYLGQKGADMFGIRQEDESNRALFAKARATYENTEQPRVQVEFAALVRRGIPVTVAVRDQDGYSVQITGEPPQNAINRILTHSELTSRLKKTGGTPYLCVGANAEVDPGLMLSAATINAMRRDALSQLTALRGRAPQRREGSFQMPTPLPGNKTRPGYTVSIMKPEQITSELLSMRPQVLYIPLSLLAEGSDPIKIACQSCTVCAVMPRIIWDNEWDRIYRQLARAKLLGVDQVLLGNIGMIAPLSQAGVHLRGDFGLNMFNSLAMNYAASMGLESLTASFELTLPQIRDLSKPVPTEMIAYGRLPLMIMENCIIHNRTDTCTCSSNLPSLMDRTGSRFPVVRDPGTCRNIILNSRKLYLADKVNDLSGLGLAALRLCFTTETPQQVNSVLRDYQSGAPFDPGVCTRGLYVRGVE